MYNTLFDTAKLDSFDLVNHHAMGDPNYDLIREIENLTLPIEKFDHFAHIKLAWSYLRLHPAAEALEKVSNSIKAFATHHGSTTKFNKTITLANIIAVANSMAEADNTESWASFVRRNTELMKHPMNVIYRLYTHERLTSPEGVDNYLEPDGKVGL